MLRVHGMHHPVVLHLLLVRLCVACRADGECEQKCERCEFHSTAPPCGQTSEYHTRRLEFLQRRENSLFAQKLTPKAKTDTVRTQFRAPALESCGHLIGDFGDLAFSVSI